MKRKSIIAVLISIAIMMTMVFASCSKAPQTLEDYIQNDAEASQQIEETAQSAGLDVAISGNNVTYTYDLKNYEGMTEEVAKSEKMVDSLGSTLDAAGETFSDLCAKLEEESKIEGIQIIVNYTYDGENLVSRTFNKDGAVN